MYEKAQYDLIVKETQVENLGKQISLKGTVMYMLGLDKLIRRQNKVATIKLEIPKGEPDLEALQVVEPLAELKESEESQDEKNFSI